MATKTLPTFEVDRAGMAKVFARKGKSFIITELLQNAWDEDTTQVDVSLEWNAKTGKAKLTVEDDNPDGFQDLRHAYTLFAESAKKSDPTKRGRFNLGEKLVIAMCESAAIETTKGMVVFGAEGRKMVERKRKVGSRFTGVLLMSRVEYDEAMATVATLIPPPTIVTTFNFRDLPTRTAVRQFEESLRTEISDDEGRLKATTRKTPVELYEPLTGEVPTLYEMGIPIVTTGDRYHVNIMQKVPLNTDRDNVTPAFLRDVRTAVLNSAHDVMSAKDMTAAWITDALQDERVEAEAVQSAVKGKFGAKAVAYDPSDPEANKIAVERGYTVVPGGALPKRAWANIKDVGAMKSAGKVTPSPQAYGDGEKELKTMAPEHYPDCVAEVVAFAAAFAKRLMGKTITVRIAQDSSWPFVATYGPSGELTLNFGRLGYNWFAGSAEPIVDLLIHEFGHERCGDHLDRKYLHALTAYGAKAVSLALEDPELFNLRGTVVSAA